MVKKSLFLSSLLPFLTPSITWVSELYPQDSQPLCRSSQETHQQKINEQNEMTRLQNGGRTAIAKQQSYGTSPYLDETLRPWIQSSFTAMKEYSGSYVTSFLTRTEELKDVTDINKVDFKFIYVHQVFEAATTSFLFQDFKDVLYTILQNLASQHLQDGLEGHEWQRFNHFNTSMNTMLQAFNKRTNETYKFTPRWQDPAWTPENQKKFLALFKLHYMSFSYALLKMMNTRFNPIEVSNPLSYFNEDHWRHSYEALQTENPYKALEDGSGSILALYESKEREADTLLGLDAFRKKRVETYRSLLRIAKTHTLQETWPLQAYQTFHQKTLVIMVLPGIEGAFLSHLQRLSNAWDSVVSDTVQLLLPLESKDNA